MLCFNSTPRSSGSSNFKTRNVSFLFSFSSELLLPIENALALTHETTAVYGQCLQDSWSTHSLRRQLANLLWTMCMPISLKEIKATLPPCPDLIHIAFGKDQRASHLTLFEFVSHAVHVAKVQRRVVTTSQKMPGVFFYLQRSLIMCQPFSLYNYINQWSSKKC